MVRKGCLLIGTDKPAVANGICGTVGGQPAFDALSSQISPFVYRPMPGKTPWLVALVM